MGFKSITTEGCEGGKIFSSTMFSDNKNKKEYWFCYHRKVKKEAEAIVRALPVMLKCIRHIWKNEVFQCAWKDLVGGAAVLIFHMHFLLADQRIYVILGSVKLINVFMANIVHKTRFIPQTGLWPFVRFPGYKRRAMSVASATTSLLVKESD